MQSKQQLALSVANQLSLNAITLKSLDANFQDLLTQITNNGLLAVWSAMATASINADGSLGAADGIPITSHPITVSNLNKSEADINNVIVMAQQLHNFLNNVQAVQGLYIQFINAML